MSSENIYQKLQDARIELQEKDLKKSGENKFAKYRYYELGDFLPEINNINQKHGLFTSVSFTTDYAVLNVVNVENPEETIKFTSPMGKAELKGCHEIQNIGAVETYQRRYLYMTAFEIVEHDALDATTGEAREPKEKPKEKAKETDYISDGQRKRLFALAKENDVNEKDLKNLIGMFGYESSSQIAKKDYKEICEKVEEGIK